MVTLHEGEKGGTKNKKNYVNGDHVRKALGGGVEVPDSGGIGDSN